MTSTLTSTSLLLPVGPDGRLRVLNHLAAHLAEFGPMPLVAPAVNGRPGALVDEIHTAGLRGRGGGWFPTARKVHAVVESAAARRALSGGRKPVVVANAMEGEPASSKDYVLLTHAPHLVLDGLQAAALTVGATTAYLAVHRGSPIIGGLQAAIAERRTLDVVKVELVTPPARYVASEETALSHWIGDKSATPVYGAKPFQRGIGGRPTLVQNAETLGHIGLIARHGGAWFASVGDPIAPGTSLVSVGGAVHRPGVIEVATGTPVVDILAQCGGADDGVVGFLTGGYGGGWAAADAVRGAHWTPESMREAGAVIGAGILWALDPHVCPITEIARVASYMAGESAGQCGPCRFGLPAVAHDLAMLDERNVNVDDLKGLRDRLALIVGRGGCKHPDGVTRFIETGLHVFHAEVAHHLAGHCSATSQAITLPVPEARKSPVARGGRAFR